MTYKTLAQLHQKYNWRSINKFVPIAKKYGFTETAAKNYLNNIVVHDLIVPKPKYLNIYSKHHQGFQMDTFINDKSKDGLNYLMLININSRKAFCYSMIGKGAKEVKNALEKFIRDEPDVYSITSDQDAAFLSNEVLEFMKAHNINYRTTEDNNHNVLGIINRFMRTIRDLVGENRFIEQDEMKDLVDTYNNSPHKSIGKAPNDFTDKDEDRYIKQKAKINPYNFKQFDKVRLVEDKNPLGKRRTNVSKKAYEVDSRSGNQFIIRAKDNSIDKVPGYEIVKATTNIPLAKTLKNNKRGIVERLTSYDQKKNKYHVVYDDGQKDFIPARNLRESIPTKLSEMELEYWATKKSIPENIKKWI